MILNGRHIGLALVAAILKIERGSDQILIKHALKNTYANFHAFMKFCTPKFVRSLATGFAEVELALVRSSVTSRNCRRTSNFPNLLVRRTSGNFFRY